ncbi:hypothetical protein A1D31_35540 [Bradyrhizobium liaoningense]|nr:hypothetical protein A1D31_35540 [Bradyrhizobium liaoningense]
MIFRARAPSGLSLGREEWLGDEHILADFTLVQHELQRDNPILAVRTRFVDRLIAHQLREGVDGDMLAHSSVSFMIAMATIRPTLGGGEQGETSHCLALIVTGC